MKFFKEKEGVLIEALRLKESGIPLREIISCFPENEKEIREFFQTENAVSDYFKSISPSEDVLFSVLKNLPAEAGRPGLNKMGVTNSLFYRYNDVSGKTKGRFNLKEELSNLMLKKFLVPGVVVVLIIVGFVALRNQSNKVANKSGADIETPADNGNVEIGLPSEPAANPTAIANAIIALATNEQSEISGYDDEALLESDSQEIAELNTIYDETDFQ